MSKKELREAYRAGWDTIESGVANVDNCNIKFFSSEELKDAWEEGRRDAKGGKDERD